MYFLILAWTKYCIWTVLKELIVRQTLTPTRDHPPNSPHCTHIAGYKSEGEVCIWSAVGAQRVKRPVIRPKLFIPQEIIDQAGYRAQVVLEVSLGLGLGDRRSLPLNVHYPVLSCTVLYCTVLYLFKVTTSDVEVCQWVPQLSQAVCESPQTTTDDVSNLKAFYLSINEIINNKQSVRLVHRDWGMVSRISTNFSYKQHEQTERFRT